MAERAHPNRLVHETSPYLRQHACNPVDWFPWGDEALQRARNCDLPILLSIGYSACHWCHVMERESFEDERIARLMNEYFVNIKVDREERPDLDEIYMGAVQAMTGSGGWPMTVFLTPDLRPFYGGTYYPPEDRYGRPGFPRILEAVQQHYRTHRDQVETRATELTTELVRNADRAVDRGQVGEEVLDQAFAQLCSSFDHDHGGFGQAPKFPASASVSLLLRHWRRTGRTEALDMAVVTLRKMARGGLYDHLGGGFHRYSTDERWLVPHFEKMLYDNALLTWAYLEAYQATGDPFLRRVVQETLGYVQREMAQPGGGFYATQDADSEGEEGRFFVWEPGEVEAVLGREAARLFMRYYDVTPEGNFEGGKSILHAGAELPALAAFMGVGEEEYETVLTQGRTRLLAVRQQRVPPGRDEKILVSWNGLMISAMARAYQVVGDESWLRAATQAADFVLDRMVRHGELLHTYKDGQARLAAYQDDYASLANGLLDLYEADFQPRWLAEARRWTGRMVDRFWDQQTGGFFLTEAGAADLILRPKNYFDGATPSGNSLGALALLRLAALTGDDAYRQRANQVFRACGEVLRRAPTGCAQMLCALDLFRSEVCQIAVVGPVAQRRPLLDAVHGSFLPGKVVAAADPADDWGEAVALVPLLAGKESAAPPAVHAYVCRGGRCSPPADSAPAVQSLLARSWAKTAEE